MWDLEKTERARKALLALKNTIYYFILNNRQDRKMPKLKEILFQGIERQKKQQAAKRKMLDSLNIDSIESTADYLTDDQFVQLTQNYDKIKINMADLQFHMGMLDTKLQMLYLDPSDKREYEKKK